MSGHTVLIVDDSLTVRMDVAEAFTSAGFSPLPCSTAAAARAALARGAADVIVLDILLPDGDGIELLKEIRGSPTSSDAVVLMLSTEAEVRDRIRGLRTGADEYVGKPYDVGYLVAKARELVQQRHASEARATRTVLVIDDSITFREELKGMLEGGGLSVVTASTGEEGLRLAGAHRPDAILVDGVLPGIDGATVIRRIRLDAALRDVPCLLLTASEDKSAELRALDAGADAFVRKDDHVDVILARVWAVLRRSGPRAPAESTRSLLGPKKILAVDDSATYLHTIAAALKDEGYDVVLARSGEEAIEWLAVQAVDCILLDLMMPGLSGQDTCQRIKAAPIVRDIPLIMLTAREDREAMIQGLGAGADDYISKSSEFEVLKARVRAQIRRKQFEDENRRIREELLRTELEAAEARAARELADARALLVEELERKNRELEAFSYSVSHDLRAPLRAIDGFSQALLEDCGEALDGKGKKHLQRVLAAAQRMGNIIDDLLQLSRVGRAELHCHAIDLSQIAGTVAADLRKQQPDRHVRVEIEEGLTANADGRLMRVTLDNLLGNAWKFTSHVADARIEVGRERRGSEAAFFVRDNGAGFDMAHADRLFRPFQRLHSESEFAGIGIGLATVLRIVDRHGGRVWAEGKVGRGATIYFTLPAARSGGQS